MIDIKALRKEPEFFKDAFRAKGVEMDVDVILKLDEEVRELKIRSEKIRSQKNAASKEMAAASADVKADIIAKMKEVDGEGDATEQQLKEIDIKLNAALSVLPNPALPDVKVGKDETENEIVRIVGKPKVFTFTVKDHAELGKILNIINLEAGAVAAGARFTYLQGDAVLLQFALLEYALGIILDKGFIPVIPPHMLTEENMGAMGYLEHGGKNEIYFLEKDKLYLIGTSEQVIGPMHRDEVFDIKELPRRYVGYSPCYRREAGSYGKDTKGILRLHQFDKLELFSYTTPEQSGDEHEFLLSIEEKLVSGLGLPYRVVKQCTGDLGLPAARKYDIEVWIPSQNAYRETHSTSNCTDWQARRLNIKVKGGGKTEIAHTLNGTAFAIGRMLVAILENEQNEDGTVNIPDALIPFMRGRKIIG
ncbi:MAG: serine--tRNA ligase [Patescibacteria group bacterium]